MPRTNVILWLPTYGSNITSLKSKKNFKGQSSEKTWLTSILKYKIIDFIRKKYKEPLLENFDLESTALDDHFDAMGKWKTGPAKWASDPEQLLEQKSFLDIVKKSQSTINNVFEKKLLPEDLIIQKTNDNSVFIKDDLSRLGRSGIQTVILITLIFQKNLKIYRRKSPILLNII